MSTTDEPLDYAQAAQLADEAHQRLRVMLGRAAADDLLGRLAAGLKLSAVAERAAIESGALAGEAIDRVIAHAQDRRDTMMRAYGVGA